MKSPNIASSIPFERFMSGYGPSFRMRGKWLKKRMRRLKRKRRQMRAKAR
jgi:hypothetical protein